MKKSLVYSIGIMLFAACGSKSGIPSRDELSDSISRMETTIASYEVTANTEKANEMIGLYRLFVENYPDDSLAPIYMLRMADIDINMGGFEEGLAMLDSIITLYPGFEDVGYCQFLKGWAYEQNQQYDLAREAYVEFLANNPDHVLAADTRKNLPYLGMTPEEQLEAATKGLK